MNILLLSGSPRKNGNTNALLEELTAGILEAGKHSVKTVDVTRMKIAPCLGCDGCKRGEKICVQKDDSQLLMNEMRQADYLVFATPVYWWGMTAQLKLAIDRLYADSSVLKGKPIGLIVTGADALDSPQYRLIREQFQCMADYVGFNSGLLQIHFRRQTRRSPQPARSAPGDPGPGQIPVNNAYLPGQKDYTDSGIPRFIKGGFIL